MDGNFFHSPLDLALELADTYGWHVFPMKLAPKPDGKHKKIYLAKWGSEATNDPSLIERLNWREATHVGVSCAPSGAWVVDEDKPGAASGLNLTETLIMGTPRGRHYVYRAAQFDQRNTQSDPAPAVDIRANGGMFVCYGKVIHDAEIAPWPFPHPISSKPESPNNQGFKIDTGPTFKGVDDYQRLIHGARTEGEKHAATRDIAASLAGQGVSEKFATGLIQAICPVWDANLQNSITSAYEKYRRNSFRHNGLDLIRDDKERPIWNAANAEKLLTEHEDWQGVFSFNVFTGRRMRGENALDDDDYQDVTAWFNANGFPKASQQIVIPAVRKVCRKHSFDPLRDYLESLHWDETPRLASWLTTYCGAEATSYVSEVGKRWMISAVARAFKPGCKADHMLVLEGAQGRRKSSAVAALASEDWFSDALPQMGSKDAQSYLRGKWIIEVGELEAMRREVDAIKAFISRQVEAYRPAYGREEVSEPRRCVFIGTTNKDDWQRDETGGRRFWPVKVGEIDVDAVKRDRDQIWGEAVAMFKKGERWWLEGEVEEQARTEAAERRPDDPWRSDIACAVQGHAEVTTKQVLGVMGVLTQDMTPALSRRVSLELVALGWERAGRITSGEGKGAARYVPREAVRQE